MDGWQPNEGRVIKSQELGKQMSAEYVEARES